MTNYRRLREEGASFFFTVVTFDRRPILTSDLARSCFRDAFLEMRKSYPVTLDAVCLLPEHLHCIWTLPDRDDDYSTRWRYLKSAFTRSYLAGGGTEGARNASRQRKGEAAVWQRRFWEHKIRGEDDFNRHFDYIHFNPVHHGLVTRPEEWPWSSYHRCVREGYYEPGWGAMAPPGSDGLSKMVE